MTQNDTMTKHNNLEFHLKNSLNVGLSFQPEKGFCHLGSETLHLRHLLHEGWNGGNSKEGSDDELTFATMSDPHDKFPGLPTTKKDTEKDIGPKTLIHVVIHS